MEISLIIFYIIVLIFSVIIHEVAHGAIADWLGDPTARLEGRLTLNPIKHIDPFGSVILPALLFWATAGQSVFGWAKPVPYNPYNLKNPKSGGAIIAAAGPLSNVILAVVLRIQ
jgi:Zn-dependent protease